MKKLFIVISVALLVGSAAGAYAINHKTAPKPSIITQPVIDTSKPIEAVQTAPESVTQPIVESPKPTQQAVAPADTRTVPEKTKDYILSRGFNEENWYCFDTLVTKTIGWNMTYDQAKVRADFIIDTAKWPNYCSAYGRYVNASLPGRGFYWEYDPITGFGVPL